MALIPRYHTAVAMFPVDPADLALINAGSSDATYGIYAGQIVGIGTNGYVKHATASNASTKYAAIGIAGDSMATAAGHSAYTDSLVVNPGGGRKSTQNRVSDYFNETLGSGLLTVYINGGEFYTDMWLLTELASFTPGTTVYNVNATAYTAANAGYLSVTSTNAYTVGVCTSSVKNYPNGVPGVDGGSNIDYSMSLNSINGQGFISFIMQM
jgi:hypothetical protein